MNHNTATFRVEWTYRFTREIKAKSKAEAIAIAEDLGDINADFTGTEKRAIRLSD